MGTTTTKTTTTKTTTTGDLYPEDLYPETSTMELSTVEDLYDEMLTVETATLAIEDTNTLLNDVNLNNSAIATLAAKLISAEIEVGKNRVRLKQRVESSATVQGVSEEEFLLKFREAFQNKMKKELAYSNLPLPLPS